ncbi:hypothetical protein [Actinospica robiniae]|uniref:hypothetical protein n=1 Tax=Actinospica robiniae TaxID=304901 RepID=UPI0005578AA6|nr:hypothetical protein [Actinospica robiniae]
MEETEIEIEFLESEPDPDARPLGPADGWRRPAAFVLALGLCVGAASLAGVRAYRHDRAADRAAATLVLRVQATGDPVGLPGAATLGSADSWGGDPSTTVEVDVVNRSPDAVTLLPDAVIRGPGVFSASLAPSGGARLEPGEVGRLVGTARVDCTLPSAAGVGRDAQSTLLVRARLADGSVGTAPIGLNTGGESVREEICLQQGATVASGNFAESADPLRHTFTISLTARSLLSSPLSYTLTYQYSDASRNGAAAVVPNTALGAPAPAGTIAGLLVPEGRLAGGFTWPVTQCPLALPEENVDVELQLIVTDSDRKVLLQADEFDLSLLAAAACGQFN